MDRVAPMAFEAILLAVLELTGNMIDMMNVEDLFLFLQYEN